MFVVVCNGCMLRDFVIDVLQPSRVITAVRRQQNMPLHDRIIPKVKQMTVCYTWFHERFRVLPADATDETVRVYARAYILMLLSSQLFADKNANRVHLRWLPYLASLDDLGRYSWGSAALAWLYRCLCRGTNRNVLQTIPTSKDFTENFSSSKNTSKPLHP
ncbi:hypothetical protein Ahy_B08g094471 [Arachis hypogaea]|uniref:Aminotransferase-like plant mobile domain-containing protein n=1 Tax=Arachis hypogaea TaxID=3818 RepID=A0A444Y8Z0_ARAHY|nr:hypothetical protein Ahy_B08g094471 [Arachis hypogaea]